jgi:O-antigen ligase
VITGIFLVANLLVALGLLAGFMALERSGRRMTTVLIVLGMLVVECVIYPDPNSVPAGLFHPAVGGEALAGGGVDYGLSFRLPDILIPAALLARLLTSKGPMRLQAASLWWLAFALWIATSAVIGVHVGNSRDLIVYEGKLLVYLGLLILAAGVPATDYAHGREFRRFLGGCSIVATIVIVLSQLDLRLAVDIPGLPLEDVGYVGTDTATVFLGLGLVALAIGVCSEADRMWMLLASAPLCFASIAAEQRAAFVALGLAMLTLVLLAALGWRRVQTTLTEIALIGAAFGALLLVPLIVTATSGTRDPVVPIVRDVTYTFTAHGKQLSAQSRRYQWRKAKELIAEHPVYGSGLGTVYRHYDPGYKQFLTTNLTHNVALDLLLRTGAIGVALFAIALAATLRDGIRGWLRHNDALVAAVALGATSAIVGLIGKGMVESIFEKYRLATMLGFLLGVVASVTLSLMARTVEEASESDASARRLAWS